MHRNVLKFLFNMLIKNNLPLLMDESWVGSTSITLKLKYGYIIHCSQTTIQRLSTQYIVITLCSY